MVILKKISVMPVAKIFCILHAIIGILLGLIVTVGSMTNQESEGIWSLGAWSLLVFPAINSVLGFFTGIFLAASYNLISQWMGGFQIEVEDKS